MIKIENGYKIYNIKNKNEIRALDNINIEFIDEGKR